MLTFLRIYLREQFSLRFWCERTTSTRHKGHLQTRGCCVWAAPLAVSVMVQCRTAQLGLFVSSVEASVEEMWSDWRMCDHWM